MPRRQTARATLVAITAVSLVSPPFLDVFRADAQAPAAPAPSQAPKTPPLAAVAATPPVDGGWPKAGNTPSGAVMLMYQPQIASWTNQKQMVLYSAVSYTPKGATKNSLGTIKAEVDTSVSLEERLVNFTNLKVTEANFPNLQKDQLRELTTEIDRAIPKSQRIIALDRVLANLDKSKIIPRDVQGLKADPPNIFFSKSPAILVNFDGDPIWSPIKDNDLKFAVNTNWDVFQHEASKTFYLRNFESWLTASDLKGPWKAASKLPASFSKLPADENWKEVKANVPGKPLTGALPAVNVSTQPGELILLRGEPNYLLVQGTKLLWVSNTDSDVFRLGKGGPVYFLVAGRWFSAPDFTGPWTFATPNLPEDFKKIPPEHARSRVLASVPGTSQAVEAVLLAQVPETARVNKKELKAPDVVYQGDPQFAPIETTTMQRAVNTDKDIVKVGDLYYMCFQGVWFVSTTPQGPWQVSTDIPKDIYTIPTSSPVHNVTYVTVEDNSDDWATFAVVAGYTGMMVGWGCAVWGSGWYYPPYIGYGGFYPVYYPRFPTYGYSAWYNPWTGGYGRGAVAYGPYGGVGVGARYNPRTGTYARGAVAASPYGARGAAQAWNPRTGTYAQTRQGSNVYGSWGSTSVQRGDNWAQTARTTNRVTDTMTRTTRTSEGGAAVTRRGPDGTSGVARTGSGDVYAGNDGNVYRKQDGSWQKYDNGNWGSVTPPDGSGERATQARERAQSGASAGTQGVGSGTYDQLQRDSGARSEGTQRTSDYSTYKGSGGSRSSGSTYRPSGGGGFRGGGGRRR